MYSCPPPLPSPCPVNLEYWFAYYGSGDFYTVFIRPQLSKMIQQEFGRMLAVQAGLEVAKAVEQCTALEGHDGEPPELVQGYSTAASQELPESTEEQAIHNNLQADSDRGSPEGAQRIESVGIWSPCRSSQSPAISMAK